MGRGEGVSIYLTADIPALLPTAEAAMEGLDNPSPKKARIMNQVR